MSCLALTKKVASAMETRQELVYTQMLPYNEAVLVAAMLANKANWAPDVDSPSFQPFLGDSCSAMRPIGIEERLEQEALAENDDFNQDVQWFGHLFVFERQAFVSILQEVPADLQKSLLALVKVVPSSDDGRIISQENFEDMYYDDCNEVFEWQERVPDEHLEVVLEALKKLVSHKNPFLRHH